MSNKPSSFSKPPAIIGDAEKPRNFGNTGRRLLRYFKQLKGKLLVAILMTVLSTVFTVLAPEILGRVTTQLYIGVTTEIFLWDKMITTLLLLTVIYLISQVFAFGQNFLMAEITSRIIYLIRTDLNIKLNRLPLRFLDSKTHGELLSRVTNDVETVSSTLQHSFTQIISSLTTLAGISVMMLLINIWISLVAFAVIPLALLTSSIIIKASQKYFINQQAFIGAMNGHVEEMYTGYSIVRSFNYEEEAKTRFSDLNKKILKNSWRAEFLSGILSPLAAFLGNIGYVGVAVLGCFFAIRGQIEVGQIQAFLQYVKQFNNPISIISNAAGTLQAALAAAERIFEILDEAEESAEHPNPVKLENVQGNVSIRQVNFSYLPGQPVIRDFNLEVKSGQTVAIVGPTGSGKTTLINLFMRFYDVDDGSIKIDGIDIRDMKRDDLRGIFGMVLQDTWLFNGTIAENIAYGRQGATRQQVVDAAKTAYVHQFIRTLPNSYDMRISEDAGNISQGQKQLLTIARAIIADSPILILDEATSSVDTRTEVLIQNAMNRMMQGRTSFVIAHRLSTIRNADIILVLNHGDIVEKGSHTELMAKKGFYHSLYNSQFAAEEPGSA
ncbi:MULTISPECIES: ABC transporter ATP-binding protein [Pelosinus]|uniref:ABC transporter transmembrane region n=1 Tax=Pelosinus fermentans B4 TaxID=1149862 RepID=I8RLD6_9FIRM|nr:MULTISPECIES: ABC transporter ATP-binding protein [Pelosinus]EIW19385.1 ABC transporter transmembrane region [Pelosinus fermentans B4]EIW24884.1 ABC transporter related protein [Pelosinus fermentans A11]